MVMDRLYISEIQIQDLFPVMHTLPPSTLLLGQSIPPTFHGLDGVPDQIDQRRYGTLGLRLPASSLAMTGTGQQSRVLNERHCHRVEVNEAIRALGQPMNRRRHS